MKLNMKNKHIMTKYNGGRLLYFNNLIFVKKDHFNVWFFEATKSVSRCHHSNSRINNHPTK